jgi:DUF4097 and DUF4098 domain-containing protein YvlB
LKDRELKKQFYKWVGVAVLTCGVTAAWAEGNSRIFREGGDWVQETTGSIPASRTIRIKTRIGTINLTGGSVSNVSYTMRWRCGASANEEEARRFFESLKLNTGRSGDVTYFVSEGEGRWRRASAELTINVPREVELVKASTDAGNIQVSHLGSRVEAESGGGNIQLDDVRNSVAVQTGGGNVTVGTVNGDIRTQTGGGSIHINSAGGRVTAETGGGNVYLQSAKGDVVIGTGAGVIHVEKVGGNLRATTGGNNIDVGDVGGTIELETGGGNIRMNGGSGYVKASTGGGNIQCYKITKGLRVESGAGGITAEIQAQKGQFVDSKIETGVGDIVVYIPSDLAVTIRAGIDAGSANAIHSDFPGLRVTPEGGEFGPRELYAEGNLNGGGPVLKLHTSTGKIQVLQLKR